VCPSDETVMSTRPLHIQPTSESGIARDLPLVVGDNLLALLDTKARKLSRSSSTILISGETGTGKSLAARYLFGKAENYTRSLRTISLNEIPEALFESQLFGHRKGAFTGADRDFEGKIASADRGTIVLEDIATLPLHLQTKLLRLIENKEFERVGDLDASHVDIRFIATTNVSLEKLVQEDRFRRDLFYRLRVIEISLPPLRARLEDLDSLASYYIKKFSHDQRKPITALAPDAITTLRVYPWPGNVRELIAEIECAVSMADPLQHVLLLSDFSERIRANDPTFPIEVNDLAQAHRRTDRELIMQALARSNGNRVRAALELGISRRTLYNKLKELGLRL